jgi:hypothetical protein
MRYIDMKILTTSTGDQTFKVIPRSYPASITLKLRDDSTNTETTYTITPTTDKGKMVITQAFSLEEGRYYDLTILDGSDIIYKDKVFCTDQTISSYSVNNNEYTQESSYDNDYIVI